MLLKNCLFFLFLTCLLQNGNAQAQSEKARAVWAKEKASDWYSKQEWLVGANFIPSTAINQLEMWQEASFDKVTIDRELGYARAIGMNTMRVYLHDLLWDQDSTGFVKRINAFLEIADKHHIKPFFVLFDSCWDPFPKLGKQRMPTPFVHNSGWVQSPGYTALKDSTQYKRLERYVKGVVSNFKDDKRVLGWDVWNEPDNTNASSYGKQELPDKINYVLPLLQKAFLWCRFVNPTQPITSGVWVGDWSAHDKLKAIDKLQLEQSDIITFHNYDNGAEFEKRIQWLQRYGKPILCTEYMARGNNSTFGSSLPIAHKYRVGIFNWGLVDGKTQTKYAWDSWAKKYTAEPELWFHEIFHKDGKPYRSEETTLIKQLTAETNQGK